ncbi:MAG: PRC-barrel domain-containing protein [Chthoniobacterales bacterium]
MHAVTAAGGFTGIGDKITPVAWDRVNVKLNEDGHLKLMTMLDKSTLTSMKSYDLNDKTLIQKMPDLANGKFVRLSKVDDAKLFDTNGHQIGAIKDTILDAKTGKVAYAVITFDDAFINQGDQMTMVPWTLIRQSEKDTPGYVLHADKTKLEGATFFAPKAWPNMHDFTWNKEVYDYYAVSPYYWTGV